MAAGRIGGWRHSRLSHKTPTSSEPRRSIVPQSTLARCFRPTHEHGPQRRLSTVLVFGVAFLIGFRPSAGPIDWLAAGGVLLLFILAIAWLAAAFGLLLGLPVGTSPWKAVAWCLGILVVSVPFSGVLFRRRTA